MSVSSIDAECGGVIAADPTSAERAATIDDVAAALRAGKYLTAFAKSQALGPLPTWRATEARILAGRLAFQLGAPRWASTLLQLAWRNDRDQPRAAYYFAYNLANRRGPWAAYEWMSHRGDLDAADDVVRGDWFALRGHLLAALRDFDRARQWIDRAIELCPERAWVRVEQSAVLAADDRHAEALDAARHAFELEPWYRPAVQALADHLLHLGHDGEALELLREAVSRLESGMLVIQLIALEQELDRHADARAHFGELDRLLPLAQHDRKMTQWLAARGGDLAYRCGDHAEAARLLRACEMPFQVRMAERLADANFAPTRVVLPVEFVRQHYMTCSPATLSAIARFWKRAVDHVELADQICYDGTPAHAERRWAQENGWRVREFRVTSDAARQLIDRGVPFTLTTVFAGGAHLQAVIGYDTAGGSLVIRDPTERLSTEFDVEALVKHQDSTGPRGMVFVPQDRAGLVDDLLLADADMYDLHFQAHDALDRHDRDAAQRVLVAMRERDADHFLTIHTRGSLASYDGDPISMLAATRRKLQQFPTDTNLQLSELSLLRSLGRRDERIARLEELSADRETDPLLWRQLAQELLDDPREARRALDLLKRFLRTRALDGQGYGLLADLAWNQGRRDQVAALDAFARDAHAMVAGLIADLDGQQAAVDYLRQAIATMPHHLPLRSMLIERLHDGPEDELAEAIGEYIDLVPVDAWARNEQAILLLRQRRFDEALDAAALAAELDAANPVAHLVRGQALQAQGREREAREAFRTAICKSVDYRPAIDALVESCQTHAERVAALEFVYEQLVAQVVFGEGLLTFYDVGQPSLDRARLETVLREALEHRPDLWHAWSAMVRHLARTGQLDEALRVAQQAVERFPLLPRTWLDLAGVYHTMRDAAGEIAAIERALEINPSWSEALRILSEAHAAAGDMPQALATIDRAIARDPAEVRNHGQRADLLWRSGERDRALEALEHAVRTEPGYDWGWSCLREWSTAAERFDIALAASRELAASRPGEARSWLVLADTLAASGPLDERLAALDRALALNPQHVDAHDQRATVLAEMGRFDEARAACRPAAFAEPPLRLRGREAEILWRSGEQTEARQAMRHVLSDDPNYGWGWYQMVNWHDPADALETYAEAAEHLVRLSPDYAMSWGYRGDARRRQGNRQAARQDFLESASREPDYVYGLAGLIELSESESEYAEAQQALEASSPHLLEADRLALAITLACQRGRREEALASFESLCAVAQPSADALAQSIAAMRVEWWATEGERVMLRAIAGDAPRPEVACSWVRACLERVSRSECGRRLARLPQGANWDSAAIAFVEALRETRDAAELRRFVRKHRKALRASVEKWSAAGAALARCERRQDAVRWMSDWRTRGVPQASMLIDLALSLWMLDRRNEAAAVSQAAERLPIDYSTPYHRLWLAVAAVHDADLEGAERRIESIDAAAVTEFYQALCELLRETILLWRAARDGADGCTFGQALSRLQDLRRRHAGIFQGDRLAQDIWRACIWRVARAYRRVGHAVWAWTVSWFS